jgi:pimeloyl-ACP methyl ester carboxylesterase
MARKTGTNRKASVVMIHGAFCGPWSLDGFKQQFEAAGYAVKVPCLRFHDGGKPPEALATTGLADFCADLEQELDTLNAPPILLGYSMGGLLAQLIAARRTIAAAILLAPSAPWGVPPSTLFEIGAAQALFLNSGFWARVLLPSRDAALATSLNLLPRAERDQVFERLLPESGRAMFEILHWGLDMNRASEIDTAKVTCPLLFLSGAEDRVNPPGTVARNAALYKGRASHQIIPGMGHWLLGEPGWEKLAGRALSWLEGL